MLRSCRLVLALLAALCGSCGIARADYQATATLLPGNEVPPHVTPATGFATLDYFAASDVFHLALSFQDLAAPATAAHIHVGDVGVNGPIIFPLADFPNTTTGMYKRILTAADLVPRPDLGINTFADAVDAVKGGHTYLNIHNAVWPGGEIRGQFQLVPEPSSLLLLLGAGLPVARLRLRRRRA